MASGKRLLVENLMTEIRRYAGEMNDDGSISDELLIDTLNRAQQECEMLLSRHTPDSLLTYTDITTDGTSTEYDMPEDCAEGRIQMVDFREGTNSPIPLEPSNTYENWLYEADSTSTGYPSNFMELGYDRQLRILPKAKAGLTLRIWYVRELPDLVVSQGKITVVNTGTETLTLDEVGDDITASLNEEGSHLSIIDGQTGARKGVIEVRSVDEDTGDVVIQTTPEVSAIDNVTVASTLVGMGVNAGDYVCVGPSSCICQIKSPVTNYMIQYAFALIQQVNGADAQMAYAALSRLEKFVSGREKGKPNKLRVKLNSPSFQPRFPVRNVIR